MLSEKEKIELIARSILDINKVKDLDLLLERILRNAREFFNADAGSIYLKEGKELKFSISQNSTLQKRSGSGNKLIYHTFSMPINNSSIAGYVAENQEIVNIPDVYQISDEVPYTFDSGFDALSEYRTRSMLTVPLTNQNGDVLGVMQVINSQDENGNITAFSPSDEPHILQLATLAALPLELAQTHRNLILTMIKMLESRDPRETWPHVNRVAAYSVEIFEEWIGRNSPETKDVERQKDILKSAAMLHDVGKIAISDTILTKPARLTASEFEIIKTHTVVGAQIFKYVKSDFGEAAAQIALNHHEKWDGTGYPGHIDPMSEKALPGYQQDDGRARPKQREEIPLFARIVAVADVYDALCSRRSYKPPWDEDRVLNEMHRSTGKHFDPQIIQSFLNCFDTLKSIAKRYPDEDE